jgi:iron complex outermembrane receptor protein
MFNKKKLVLALSGISILATGTFNAAQASTGILEEIVVTAQHRSESLQDTSVSIDVLTADTLQKAGVVQAVDIGRVAPGVQVTMGGTAIQIYIRGAGDFSTTGYNEAAVAQNFDGVPAARAQTVSGTFFDLERVEILKGPQGTLYGRNATGGALNIIPVPAKVGEFSGYISAGLQNYEGSSIDGAVNMPIDDTSAIRASFQVVNREGYIDDGTDDDVHNSYRLQYIFDNQQDITFRTTANYQHFSGRGPGYVEWSPEGTAFSGPLVPSDPWTSINDGLNGLIDVFRGLPIPVKPSYSDTSKVKQDLTIWGIHAQLDWELDVGTLTVIPAYQYVENASQSMPGLNFRTADSQNKPQTSDTTSLEVRLANQTDNLKWVGGIFYFNEQQETNNFIDLANVAQIDFNGDLETEAYAIFGEATYSFTENLRGILGLRYSDESKTVDAFQWDVLGSLPCSTPGTGPGGGCLKLKVDGDYQDEELTYKAGFEYDIGEESMVFATFATGFKSGGQVNADVPPYDPETLTSFTLGSKNRFFDGTWQLNGELFYIDYQDHQENLSTLDRNGIRQSILDNAGEATSKGISVESVWLATDSDYLKIAVEYNKAEFDEFSFFDYRGAPPSTVCPVTAAGAGSPAGATWEIDCSGFEMARAPEFSGNISYTHTFNLANGGTIDLTPDMTFASSRWLRANFNKNQHAPSYELYNLSATYHSPDDKYSVQMFVRNIGDEEVYTGSDIAPFIGDYAAPSIGAPRTYGARLSVNF